jgi:hypothetical protein
MSRMLAGMVGAALVIVGRLSSSHADTTTDALIAIRSTADGICGVVAAAGESQSVQVSGDVKAQLTGLAKRLADLGVSGAGSLASDSYIGVLRPDLAATLDSQRDCKFKIFDILQAKLIVSPVPAKDVCKPTTVSRTGPIDTTNWALTKSPILHLLVGQNEKIQSAYVATQNAINASINISQVTISPNGKSASGQCSVNSPGGGHTNSAGECYIQAMVEVSCP